MTTKYPPLEDSNRDGLVEHAPPAYVCRLTEAHLAAALESAAWHTAAPAKPLGPRLRRLLLRLLGRTE